MKKIKNFQVLTLLDFNRFIFLGVHGWKTIFRGSKLKNIFLFSREGGQIWIIFYRGSNIKHFFFTGSKIIFSRVSFVVILKCEPLFTGVRISNISIFRGSKLKKIWGVKVDKFFFRGDVPIWTIFSKGPSIETYFLGVHN